MKAIIIVSTYFLAVSSFVKQSYFEVEFQFIEQTYANTDMVDFSQLRLRKINGTKSIVGDTFIKGDCGNNYKAEYVVMKKQGGEYRFLPYKISPKPFCEFMSEDKFVYPELAKVSDFPTNIKEDCPLKPGTYSIRGLYLNLEAAPKAAASSGEYAAILKIYDEQNTIILDWKIGVRIENI